MSILERAARGAGFGAWAIYGVVLAAMAAAAPYSHSLTPFYSDATFDFWRSQLGYPDYIHGFYYVPAARVLFTPFAFAGPALGGAAWRLLAFGLITVACWRWARLLTPTRWASALALVMALLIAPSAAVLRNGQFDGPVWGLIALGGALAAEGRTWGAAVSLALALALKPTGVAPALMFGVLWPAVGLRLVPLALAVAALPFVNPNWTYVAALYRAWIDGLAGALPEPGRWNDLANALASQGLKIPYSAMTWVRAGAAVATFGAGLAAARWLPHRTAAFAVLALSTLYLLLFNPRTESSGYVGLALVAAPLAGRMLLIERRWALGGAVAAMCVAMGLVNVTRAIEGWFGIWLNPLLAGIFLLGVVLPRTFDGDRWAARDQAPSLRPTA